MLYYQAMPPPTRPARIGFLLSQLGAHAASVFADTVRPLGITPAEAGVVRVIGRTPGITQRQLADRLGTLPSRVVALLDSLERKGLAERTRSASDRRVQQLDLTPAGHALLTNLRSAAETQEAALAEGLSEQQRSELYELLATVSRLRGLDPDIHVGYTEYSRDRGR